MKNIKFKILGIVILALFIESCSNNDNKVDELLSTEPVFPTGDTTFATIDIANMLQMTNGEMKMFTLPTPLQVTTVLKKYDIQYSETGLIPFDRKNSSTTSFYNALILGMYTIDMGYSVTYDDTKRALKYSNEVSRLLQELSIGNEESNKLRKKFEDNVTNKDSLYKFILDAYNDAHTYFKNEGREGVGLLILTGAYLEGLNITLNSNLSQHTDVRDQLLVQQKFFLKNIKELLGFYSGYNHINVLLFKLEKFQQLFDKIEANYDGTLSNPYIPTKPVPENVVESIRGAVAGLREEILK